MPEYGKMRRRVAECPRNNPRRPSLVLISRIARTRPSQWPVYFANWGLEVWKRILTRSRGPTTVFAYNPSLLVFMYTNSTPITRA